MSSEIWLNNPTTSDPSTLDTLLNGSGSFAGAYNAWTMSHVYEVLAKDDQQNHSWTNEDPAQGSFPQMSLAANGLIFASAMGTEPAFETSLKSEDSNEYNAPASARVLLTTKSRKENEEATLSCLGMLSETACLVPAPDWAAAAGLKGQWQLKATSFDPSNISLSTTVFEWGPVDVPEASVAEAPMVPGTAPCNRLCSMAVLSTTTR